MKNRYRAFRRGLGRLLLRGHPDRQTGIPRHRQQARSPPARPRQKRRRATTSLQPPTGPRLLEGRRSCRRHANLAVRDGRNHQDQAGQHPPSLGDDHQGHGLRFHSCPGALGDQRRALFLHILEEGTASTNLYLRRIHNFALDMGWLPWPVVPKKQWPPVRFGEKRAITQEEHLKIIAHEKTPSAKYSTNWPDTWALPKRTSHCWRLGTLTGASA